MAKKLLVLFFILSSLDIYQINTRRSYYPKAIAPFFQNKIIQTLLNTRKRIFSYAFQVFP